MNKCFDKYQAQKIPLSNLHREYEEIKQEINTTFQKLMDKAWFILGDEVESFEKEFAEYCGAKYAIGVDCGLDALILSLEGLGIGKDDEVITSPHTFIATAFAISRIGAKPVLVDIEESNFNIDVTKIESKITEKTKAIIPIHLYGHAAKLDEIKKLSTKYKLKVIDDAAHAHGTKYKDQNIGNCCDASAFSFYPIKNLGCYGNGGIVTTNNHELYERVKELRNYGSKSKNEYVHIGYNSRLDEIQAAFLRVKLKKLDEWNLRRKRIAHLYLNELSKIPELILPTQAEYSQNSWYTFVIRVNSNHRDKLVKFLETNGIGSSIIYPKPIHLQECYKDLGYREGDFPITEKICKEILSLPISPHHHESEVLEVSKCIDTYFKSSQKE